MEFNPLDEGRHSAKSASAETCRKTVSPPRATPNRSRRTNKRRRRPRQTSRRCAVIFYAGAMPYRTDRQTQNAVRYAYQGHCVNSGLYLDLHAFVGRMGVYHRHFLTTLVRQFENTGEKLLCFYHCSHRTLLLYCSQLTGATPLKGIDRFARPPACRLPVACFPYATKPVLRAAVARRARVPAYRTEFSAEMLFRITWCSLTDSVFAQRA